MSLIELQRETLEARSGEEAVALYVVVKQRGRIPFVHGPKGYDRHSPMDGLTPEEDLVLLIEADTNYSSMARRYLEWTFFDGVRIGPCVSSAEYDRFVAKLDARLEEEPFIGRGKSHRGCAADLSRIKVDAPARVR